jgi:prepilin-type N-terminal cleavage/methylation domain-containing protein
LAKRILKNLPGFTLLEILIVMTLIALTSTIVLTNSSFLDRYNSDQIPTYEVFLKYLSEESALKKKKIAWFVGNKSQTVQVFQNNEWNPLDIDQNILPVINLDVLFKDFAGNTFSFNEERIEPLIIFDPMGKSTGATIEFYDSKIKMILTVDQFSQITFKKLQ